MAANKNKEKDAAWRREHNRRYVADIDKKTAEKFSEKLFQEGKGYQTWLKEQIKIYLQK